MALASFTGQIETWRLKHSDENGWIGPDLEDLYVSKYLISHQNLLQFV